MLATNLLAAALSLLTPSPDGSADVETQLLQLYDNSDEDAGKLEEAYDNLMQLRSQPLDINKVDVEELLQVPGVDLNTINAILEYRHKYGDFKSIQELDMIPGLADNMRDYLSSVLFVDNTDTLSWYSAQRLRHDLRNSHHTVILTATVPTYYRAGDKGATVSSSLGVNKYANKYLGDPVRHSLRYSMTVGNNLQLNLTGSKTAGEPFFSSGNSIGYDLYTFNLSARDLGIFRHIILGQFRAQFGMGLVLNNNLSLGKQAMLASVGRLTNHFTPHSSTSDSKHLQGAAVSIDLGRTNISAFWSYRNIDATLNADSTVATILTNGYHRTEKEIEKKGNTTQMTEGIHLKYGLTTSSGLDWSIGASFLHTAFNRDLNPVYSSADTISDSKLYRLYYPTGRSFWNAAIDYKATWEGLSLTGETAMSDNGAIATLNNIIWNAARRLTLNATQRFYSYKYQSLYGSSLNEGNAIRNESAALLGIHWGATRKLTIDAYTDYIYFPWRKYRVSSSSHAWDNNIQATLTHRQWTFSARYRIKKRQQDEKRNTTDDSTVKQLTSHTSHRLRLTAQLERKRWAAQTRIEGIVTEDSDKGVITTQSVTWRPGKRWTVYASAAYFHTDDYDTRLYSYERGMLYTFSNASYYGHGIHGALLVKAQVARWLMAQVKAGHTKYFDRSVIGTAERQIFASHQTDIDLQLCVKL